MELRLLGPVQALDAGEAVRLGGPRQVALLALLAAHGPVAVTRDALIEQLWDGAPPRSAANAVQVYVSQLRQVLGRSAIRTEGSGYRLALDRATVDCWHFVDLLDRGTRELADGDLAGAAASLHACLDLWQGTPFDGLADVDALGREAERLEQLRLTALERRLEADLAIGRHAEVVTELESLVVTHPLREHLWALLMRALYGAGRQADSLDAFRRCRDVLVEELGIEPGPELRELEQAVLRQDASLGNVARPALPGLPSGLSTDGPAFVGRDAELAWLRAALDDVEAGTPITLVLEGDPRTGRTRLAAEFARLVQASAVLVTYASGTDVLADIASRREPEPGTLRLRVLDDLEWVPAVAAPELVRELTQPPAGTLTLCCWSAALASVPVRVALSGLVGSGVATRRLGPLDAVDVQRVARMYAPRAQTDDLAQFVDALHSPTPLEAHEAASTWARTRASDQARAALDDLRSPVRQAQQARARLVQGLEDARAADPRGLPAPGGRAVRPYLGLLSYSKQEATLFFGRERLVADLLGRLVGSRFVLLAGPSGSGKSSILRAGLLPALAEGVLPGSERWSSAVLTPGAVSRQVLENALTAPADGSTRVVVVDQLEEVFTHEDEDFPSWMGAQLSRALAAESTLVVASVRTDFLDRCAAWEPVSAQIPESVMVVPPMSRAELRRVVEQPALVSGLTFETGVVETILDDAGEAVGALPLLSTALLALWERREGPKLTRAAYEETGGVSGAIDRLGDGLYDALAAHQKPQLRSILVRLADVGPDHEVVRRRVAVRDLAVAGEGSAAEVLDRLVERRLVVVDRDRVEVAHESLLTQWGRLRAWIEEDSEGRRVRAQLAPYVAAWVADGRLPSDLLRGPRLVAAAEYAEAHPEDLTALERDFLQASRDLAEGEQAQRRRSVRRLRLLAGVLAVALVGSVSATVVAVQQQRRAASQETRAVANALRADARRVAGQALAEERPDTALLLAARALLLQESSDTRAAMLALRQRYGPLRGVASPVPGGAWKLAVSPAGGLAAVGAVDPEQGTELLDLRTGASLGEVADTAPGAFSADGRLLALMHRGGNVVVYDTDLRGITGPRSLSDDPPAAIEVPGPVDLAFVGNRLVTAARTPRGLRLTSHTVTPQGLSAPEVVSTEHLATLPLFSAGTGSTESLALWDPTAQGGLLVAGGRPTAHTARPVIVSPRGSVRRGAPIRLPARGDASVRWALRPAGDVLAVQTASQLILTDARTGRRLASRPRDGVAGNLAWSADGRYLAHAGPADAVVFEYDDELGLREPTVLSGHDGEVADVAFSADGRRLFTTGADGLVLTWDPSATDVADVVVAGTLSDAGPVGIQVPAGGEHVLLSRHVAGDVVLRLCPRADPGCSSDVAAGEATAQRARLWRASSNADGTLFLGEVHPRGEGRRPPAWHLLGTSGTHRTVRVPQAVARDPGRLGQVARYTGSGALLSPDGDTIVALTGPKELGVWGADTMELERRLPIPEPAYVPFDATASEADDEEVLPRLAAYTADSEALVVIDRNVVSVVDLATGEAIATLPATSQRQVTAFAISADGSRAALGHDDGTLSVWSADDWRELPVSLEGHPSAVTSLAFDDRHLLSASRPEVQIHDLTETAPTSQKLDIPVGTSEPVVAALGDGRLVVSGVGDAGPFAPVLWDTSVEALLSHACRVAGRDLTVAEWTRVLPDRPRAPTCP